MKSATNKDGQRYSSITSPVQALNFATLNDAEAIFKGLLMIANGPLPAKLRIEPIGFTATDLRDIRPLVSGNGI